tara:strand:- start:8573 stop:8875 length:303 start_codon:yes stop_codon:yes gene_type:complete
MALRWGEGMAEPWIEAIGLVAGVLGIVAWVPQIREVWVHERHEGISLPTFFVVTVALSLWLIYGVLVKSIAMIFSNVFTLAVILAVVTGVVRLRRTESKA